jgi:diaminopimelate epimerase
MLIEFSKMHGLGNDFMVVDAVAQEVQLSADDVRRLADRHVGIGFDQLLLVEPPRSPDLHFHITIFNADGSEAEQCGNGARCIARFAHRRGLIEGRTMRVGTIAVEMTLELAPDGNVTVDMGVPVLDPARVPFEADREAISYRLWVGEETVSCGVVSLGNPHCVITVDDVGRAPVESLGPAVSNHSRFPESTNVGFMQILTPEHIRLRVFERVVGETLACGSGACAATVVGRLQHDLSDRVTVDLPGGTLTVLWSGPGDPVHMTGPAVHVFDGRVEVSSEE